MDIPDKSAGPHLIQRTSSSCPSRVRRQAPHSMSHNRIVLSELPDTTNLAANIKFTS